jgi:glutamate synthase (NADPH/NADH) small chain
MGKPTGFKEYTRETAKRRPVELRVLDWDEVYHRPEDSLVKTQAARCMDCGVPFCNNGCPLGNKIPDWNDLVYHGHWREAVESLLSTNNFPEWTGRICPAPCEDACVLGINDKPVTIKTVEQALIDKAFDEGWITPKPPARRTGKRVAVVGSGPAGLAVAAQLNYAGHHVTVFERSDRPGGLLLYGIPDFKMDKSTVSRRIKLLEAEGIIFRCHANIGVNVKLEQLRKDFDAIVLATGATAARDVQVPGRDLKGIHLAMNYLPLPTKANLGDEIFKDQHISAEGKDVLIIGGGDTAADCLGSAHRQKAKSVVQLNIYGKPPEGRSQDNPWPYVATTFRSWPAHEEGGHREWSVSTKEFLADSAGHVRAARLVRVETKRNESGQRITTEVPGSEFEIPCQLVLVAIGFTGPETEGPVTQLKLKLDPRGNVAVDAKYRTSAEGIYACGDNRRGQSLVVWAISEGRQCARAVDEYLMGYTDLGGEMDLLSAHG